MLEEGEKKGSWGGRIIKIHYIHVWNCQKGETERDRETQCTNGCYMERVSQLSGEDKAKTCMGGE